MLPRAPPRTSPRASLYQGERHGTHGEDDHTDDDRHLQAGDDRGDPRAHPPGRPGVVQQGQLQELSEERLRHELVEVRLGPVLRELVGDREGASARSMPPSTPPRGERRRAPDPEGPALVGVVSAWLTDRSSPACPASRWCRDRGAGSPGSCAAGCGNRARRSAGPRASSRARLVGLEIGQRGPGLLLGLADDARVLLVRLGDEAIALVLAVLHVLVSADGSPGR